LQAAWERIHPGRQPMIRMFVNTSQIHEEITMADPTSNPTITPNTQESINSVNANMANVLDFQNQVNAAMSLWEARISVNSKSWQTLDQAIQSLQR
jgi:hypothetical protein